MKLKYEIRDLKKANSDADEAMYKRIEDTKDEHKSQIRNLKNTIKSL